jgi:hypothetical protein
VFLKNQPKIIFMRTLKKPFTLLLILSHLNAFVLGSVGNVYAANQEVNTVKSPQTFVDVTPNREKRGRYPFIVKI